MVMKAALPLIGRSSLDQAEDTSGLCSSPARATSMSKLLCWRWGRDESGTPPCAASLRAWHPLAGLPFPRGFWPERFTGQAGRLTAGVREWSLAPGSVWRCHTATAGQRRLACRSKAAKPSLTISLANSGLERIGFTCMRSLSQA